VNAVMNLRVQQNAGNLLSAYTELEASRDGLSSTAHNEEDSAKMPTYDLIDAQCLLPCYYSQAKAETMV
jgi:hypothetical protein